MGSHVTASRKPEDFRGVIVPLATPLDEQRAYDPAGMQRLVEHCLAQGVHGLFPMGSTGEALMFTREQRRRIAADVVGWVAGRVPVYVGITALAVEEVIDCGHDAAAMGADACVLLPHVFFAGMARGELVAYFTRVAEALPLPLVAYSLGPHRLPEQAILEIMALENVIGVKESSGDLPMIKRLAHDEPFVGGGKRMLAGLEMNLVEALRWPGMHGCIPSAANIAPGLFARVYDLCAAGEFAEAEKLQPIIDRLNRLYTTAGYSWSGIKGVKSALQIQGICGPRMCFPFGQWSAEHQQALADGLAALGDLSHGRGAQSDLLASGLK